MKKGARFAGAPNSYEQHRILKVSRYQDRQWRAELLYSRLRTGIGTFRDNDRLNNRGFKANKATGSVDQPAKLAYVPAAYGVKGFQARHAAGG
jgi:hypothetical protein